MTRKVGVGEIETGELSQSLKPDGREFGHIEIIPAEVEIPERGQIEERRVETCRALQTPIPQVEGSHAAVGVAAAHAGPAAAVRAGLPRPERRDGVVRGGGERALEPEQRRLLVLQAQHPRHGGSVVAGERTGGW